MMFVIEATHYRDQQRKSVHGVIDADTERDALYRFILLTTQRLGGDLLNVRVTGTMDSDYERLVI